MRSLVTLSLSVAIFTADGACALPSSQSSVAAEPSVRLIQRKGTRNYVPGEAGALTVPSDTQTGPERDSLEECMAIWDAGTHITKSKWREICKRQIKERAAVHSGAPAQSEP